jgi:hypothetical protein
MRNVSTWIWPVALGALALAAAPLVGLGPALATALALCAIALVGTRAPRLLRPTLLLAAALVAGASAIQAFASHASEPRAALALIALACGVTASACVLLVPRRPTVGRVAMLVFGLAGVVAISLVEINTLYVVAVPAWLAAAALPPQSKASSQVLHSRTKN